MTDADAFEYYPRLRRVKEHVERHLAEPLSLADVAGVAALSEKYFSTFFRARTGVRFAAWLRRLRIQRAMELLRCRDESITEIAWSTGFRDLRTFERNFKKQVSVSPSTYKRRARRNLPTACRDLADPPR
jgi:AraC family transcriptional regulator